MARLIRGAREPSSVGRQGRQDLVSCRDDQRARIRISRSTQISDRVVERTCASRRKRAIRSASDANASGRTFSATSRLSLLSRARYTSPIPPEPIADRTSYGPMRVLGSSGMSGSERPDCSARGASEGARPSQRVRWPPVVRSRTWSGRTRGSRSGSVRLLRDVDPCVSDGIIPQSRESHVPTFHESPYRYRNLLEGRSRL